jgi:hypothetical protein
LQAALGSSENRRVITLLLVGLAVREVFSFWTGHPNDFELWVRLGYAVNHGINPYGVLPPVPGLSFTDIFGGRNSPTIAYLPFWPLLTGLIFAGYSLTGFNDRFLYYFLLKQPPILGDVALAYLLFAYVRARKPGASAMWALKFWLFCPFMIIISSIWGMFDSIAICFVILSMMTASEIPKVVWTALGTFAKSVPVIYVLPITVKHLRDTWAAFASLALTAGLSLIVVAVMGWRMPVVASTIGSTAVKGGWSMSAWDAFTYLTFVGLIPSLTSTSYRVLGFLWVPVLLVSTWFAIRRFGGKPEDGLVQALLVCTLVFLIFKAQVTEQYALYLFALAALDVAVWHKERNTLVIVTMTVTLIYLVVNNFFLVRFLAPIYPGFQNFENSLYEVIGQARYAAHVACGVAFTCLNIKYLMAVWRRH